MNGMMIGTRLDGMKVVNKPMTIPQTQFHWEVLIDEPGLRSCSELCPLNFGPDGAKNGRFFRTVVTMKTACADL